MKYLRQTILLVAILLIASCDMVGSGDNEPIDFSFLDIEYHARIETRQVKVFQNLDEWNAFWDQFNEWHSENIIDHLPEVNFNRDSVVGVFWGSTSGCSNQANQGIKNISTRNTTVTIEAVGMPYMGACMAVVNPRSFIVLSNDIKFAQVKWDK